MSAFQRKGKVVGLNQRRPTSCHWVWSLLCAPLNSLVGTIERVVRHRSKWVQMSEVHSNELAFSFFFSHHFRLFQIQSSASRRVHNHNSRLSLDIKQSSSSTGNFFSSTDDQRETTGMTRNADNTEKHSRSSSYYSSILRRNSRLNLISFLSKLYWGGRHFSL